MRLRKVVEEKESLLEQVRKLQTAVEQKQRTRSEEAVSPGEEDLQNGLEPQILDLQRDANRQISDLKFKLVKSEQEVTALEQTVSIARLEGQVARYKTASEASEKVEDELKVEKRRLQRELRSALDRIDELETSNNHLTKRLEKMKANRSALLSQQ
uniref:Leucine rich repeat (in FLII) interacting protein 1b n=1 Tax=Electrophorus electricus TaxID=8005 RepID=A0A4W4GQV7_ELEEL